MSHVAGYTVAHDVSARDWQMRKNGGQWLLGKTFDTFCPLGPALVTTAAISSEFRSRPVNEWVYKQCTYMCVCEVGVWVSEATKFLTVLKFHKK